MSQSKLGSAIESLANVVIGYSVALASQIAVFPMFGIHIPLSDSLQIGLWFTVISLARSYVVRRIFNSLGPPGRSTIHAAGPNAPGPEGRP